MHGSASLLDEVLKQHSGGGSELIFLGDLIDRSPAIEGDPKVMEWIWGLQQKPKRWGLAKVTVLPANHEQRLVKAINEPIPGKSTDVWLCNSGDLELLNCAAEHQQWFEGLPYTAIRGNVLFILTAARPGVPLEAQTTDDLIWARQPFLSTPHELPSIVVHRHSITANYQIDVKLHRSKLDTGAFRSGVLSNLRLGA